MTRQPAPMPGRQHRLRELCAPAATRALGPTRRRRRVRRLLAGLLACGCVAGAAPRFWIFCGHPGDEAHREAFDGYRDSLREILTQDYGVPKGRVRELAGEECTADALLGEVRRIGLSARGRDPIWVIFLGHANPTEKGAKYNLHGLDLSAAELGRAFESVNGKAPVAVIMATTCGGTFARHLAAPGRVVVAATLPRGQIEETVFPEALLRALADAQTDDDLDGKVTIQELFRETVYYVNTFFEAQEFIQTENPLLDADGDGVGVTDPDADETEHAATIWLERRGTRP